MCTCSLWPIYTPIITYLPTYLPIHLPLSSVTDQSRILQVQQLITPVSVPLMSPARARAHPRADREASARLYPSPRSSCRRKSLAASLMAFSGVTSARFTAAPG